jgi:apolipoprotein N-acyltransferase
MLVGVTLYDHRQGSVEKFNAAILFRPDQTAIDVYRKMHLVPFGEYLPFVDTLPWLALLTPYDRGAVPRLDAGRDPTSVPLGAHSLAVSICFEDTIPQVIVRFFREAKGGRQPDVLINLSNDGWFRGSSELDVHLAIGVFRAIENRVPLARAVNTGLTALVDGNGEIKDSLPQASEGVLSVTVPLDDPVLPGRYNRPGARGAHPRTAAAEPAEMTETAEIPPPRSLPYRGPWGKFGQVGAGGVKGLQIPG